MRFPISDFRFLPLLTILWAQPAWSLLSELSPFYQERGLTTKSARLDALQLNVSIEDEANVIGLRKWGGNPAGLVLDEERNRLIGAGEFIYRNMQQDPTQTMEDYSLGTYAVYKTRNQAVAAQATGGYSDFDGQTVSTLSRQVYGQFEYNARLGGFLAGAQVISDTQYSGYSSGEEMHQRNDPLAYTLGAGYTHSWGSNALDFGIHYADDETRFSYTGYPSNEGMAQGTSGQLVFRSGKSLRLAASYERNRVEYEGYPNQQFNEQTTAFRALATLGDLPLLLGAEAGFSKWWAGVNDSSNRYGEAGVSYVPKENLLMGFEFRYGNWKNLDMKGQDRKYTLGVEAPIWKSLTGRGSFSYWETDDNVSTRFYDNVYGLGLGYGITETLKLDFSYNNSHERYGSFEEIRDVATLLATWYY